MGWLIVYTGIKAKMSFLYIAETTSEGSDNWIYETLSKFLTVLFFRLPNLFNHLLISHQILSYNKAYSRNIVCMWQYILSYFDFQFNLILFWKLVVIILNFSIFSILILLPSLCYGAARHDPALPLSYTLVNHIVNYPYMEYIFSYFFNTYFHLLHFYFYYYFEINWIELNCAQNGIVLNWISFIK